MKGVNRLAWQFKPTVPIYMQVVSTIKSRIFNGVYPPGSHLPSVRELAQEASVNPNTIQKAFGELEESGLICTFRTAGRNVTEDEELIKKCKEDICRKYVNSFVDEMITMGLSRDDILSVLDNIIKNQTEQGGDL